MLTLAINTASSLSAIALLKDGKLIDENYWKGENNEAEKIMPEIDKLLITNGHKYNDIDEVVVIKGPGSFTGLRVGVTVANTIAYLIPCKLKTLNTFDLWWTAEEDTKETAVLVFAGNGAVYVSLNKEIGEQVNMPEVINFLKEKNIKKIRGDISEEQKDFLKDFQFLENPFSFGKLIEKTNSSKFNEEMIVKPLYIKPPSITISNKI